VTTLTEIQDIPS